MITLRAALLFVTAASLGYSAWNYHDARKARTELTAASRSYATLQERYTRTQSQLDAAERHADTVERDNGLLSTAIDRSAASKRQTQAAAAPFAPGELANRMREALSLSQSGDPEGALKLLTACYDKGLPQLAANERQRQLQQIVAALGHLGETYPPAVAMLRQRLDTARGRLLAGDDATTITELHELAHTLEDSSVLPNVYDQLPPTAGAKKHVAIYAFQDFVAARRYADALFGRNATMMVSEFEIGTGERPGFSANRNASLREHAVKAALTNIEVLAGAGQLDSARSLAARLLKVDSSPETKSQLQQHLDRAGQSDLLAPATR